MGRPTGFMLFKRELPPDRHPKERIHDWLEFHLHHSEAKLRTQAARCMDCGIPFCHTGILISGIASGCPINNLIPEWNDLVYKGHWEQALERLHRTNNFPEFTGRVCPAPCEGSCTVSLYDPAVTIKNIEHEIIERAFENGWVVPTPPPMRTGKRVAVVGSGPSGLACAAQLNKAGHTVTVFERHDRAGGLLMYGIPNMKLDKSIVQRSLDLMKQEGVRFMTQVEVGQNYPAEKLLKDFDATVLCCGATQPRDLPIKGRHLQGIHFAMEFLHSNTKSLLDSNHQDEKYINAKGKNVIVIGGGDTGTDCVGTALRQGCKSVIQLEILPHPPHERPKDNPWPEWPKIYRMDYGQEEASDLYGQDPRIYSITTKKFIGDEKGFVKSLQTVDIEWKIGSDGRPALSEIAGTEKIRPAQLILLAMGFLGPESKILNALNIERDSRTNIKAEWGKYSTNIPHVFAAGDARRGQSLVVWAINEGRGAARECDRFLMGTTQLP